MASSKPRSFMGFGAKKKTASAPDAATSATSPEATSLPGREDEAPLFSVVRGNPTDEEVAVLAAALTALQYQGQKNHESLASWQRVLNRGQKLGVRLRPGPGSWRRAKPM